MKSLLQIGLMGNAISLNPMAHMMMSGLMGSMVSLNPTTHMMKTLPLIRVTGLMGLIPTLVGDPVF